MTTDAQGGASGRPSPPLMRCGHAANARDESGRDVCAICFGFDPGAVVIADNADLTGRTATCDYCRKPKPSSFSLPFFYYNEGHDTDRYYCGCMGWD